MLRQFRNLWHFGRWRTNAPTPRIRKPDILRTEPELEIRYLLQFVIDYHNRPAGDFFFVQIGAFDGQEGDPLHQLICRNNWCGILVEPQSQAFERLKRNYAGQDGLQFFNVAIGPEDGEITFYTRKSGDVQVASTQRHLLIKPGHPGKDVVERRVPCWNIHTLLEHAGAPDHIDLLQIDAEGFDFEIIRGIDFSRLKPSIIRYEHTVLSENDRSACVAHLADHGYRFVLEDDDTTAILCENRQIAA